MKLLLDTHALIWWTADAPQLSATARTAINSMSNQVFVSAASAWEITTKVRLGKLPDGEALAADFAGELEMEGFDELPITVAHAAHAGALGIRHKDPFDRMLVAQAALEEMVLVSNETAFDAFEVTRLW